MTENSTLKIKNNVHRTWIPEPLIEEAVENDSLRALAFLVKFKSSCSHGGAPNIDEISKCTGESRSAVYRYIQALKSKGLVHKTTAGWFKFDKRAELSAKYGSLCCTINHASNDSVTEIKYSLMLKLAEKLHRQQQFRISSSKLDEKTKGHRSSSKQLKRKLKKMCGDLSHDQFQSRRLEKLKYPELLTSTAFTYKHLAEEFNCSTKVIAAMFKTGNDSGRCKTKLLTKSLGEMSLAEYNIQKSHLCRDYPSLFWKSNEIFYKVCTLFEGVEYWKRSVSISTVPSVSDRSKKCFQSISEPFSSIPSLLSPNLSFDRDDI